MDNKKSINLPKNATAPGIDPDKSYGKKATEKDLKNNQATTVTRLKYDEYKPSED